MYKPIRENHKTVTPQFPMEEGKEHTLYIHLAMVINVIYYHASRNKLNNLLKAN